MALPFRVFGGCVASSGLGSPCSAARPSLLDLGPGMGRVDTAPVGAAGIDGVRST